VSEQMGLLILGVFVILFMREALRDNNQLAIGACIVILILITVAGSGHTPNPYRDLGWGP